MTVPNRIIGIHLASEPKLFIVQRLNDDLPRVYSDTFTFSFLWHSRILAIIRHANVKHSVELIESTFWYSFWDIPPLGIAGDVGYDDMDTE